MLSRRQTCMLLCLVVMAVGCNSFGQRPTIDVRSHDPAAAVLIVPPRPLCSSYSFDEEACANWHPRWVKVLHVGGETLREPVYVHEAINAGDVGPLAITGWLYIGEGRPPLLCQAQLQSMPPQCAPPFVILEDLEVDQLPDIQLARSVTWSAIEVVLGGTLADPDPNVEYPCAEGPPDLDEYIWTCVNSEWVNEYRDPNAFHDPWPMVTVPPRPTP